MDIASIGYSAGNFVWAQDMAGMTVGKCIAVVFCFKADPLNSYLSPRSQILEGWMHESLRCMLSAPRSSCMPRTQKKSWVAVHLVSHISAAISIDWSTSGNILSLVD